MAIPSVMQGLIKTEDGKVFELDSPKGRAWVETIGSFRFEPAEGKPYTVRKEASGYWYGCRKVAGKVRKKYIGKSSEVGVVKLEEIAESLESPPVPGVAQKVAQEVAQEVAQDRLTALELEVANLGKALEALQEALLGKSKASDFDKLRKVDNKVAEELQNELSNLEVENEKSRADYDALLESSTVVTKKLDQEVQKLRSQLEQERADRAEIEAELADLKQKSATVGEDLPEAADLLNQLKAKRKKSKSDLVDMEAILEILEG